MKSKKIYWGVFFDKKSGSKGKMWPHAFYNTAHEANMERLKWRKYWPKKGPYVARFILKTSNAVHYDVYEHEVKMIRK